jgi:membrane-associated protease RseP (regulator of RpoE activity)
MRPIESRWPAAGFLAGALCLAVMSLPVGALAQDDEDNDDAPQSNNQTHEYQFQNEDDDNDAGAAQPGGYLGVRVQDVTRDLQEAKDLPTDQGALVNTVDSGGPAGEAGIKRGDVIVQVNKKDVTDSGDLIRIVRGIEPGTKVPVVVVRDGDRKTLTVTVAPRPTNVATIPPHGGQHMQWNGMPPNIDMKAFDGLRAQRQEIMKELDEIQQQLSELRETDFTKLEAEIQALRDEIRSMQSAPKKGQKTAPK